MVLTSDKNYSKIKENTELLGLTVKTKNGTLKLKSSKMSDDALSSTLIKYHGIGSIIEKDAVLV